MHTVPQTTKGRDKELGKSGESSGKDRVTNPPFWTCVSQGLKPMDSNGLADPYVKLHLLPGASKVLNRPTHSQCLPARSSSRRQDERQKVDPSDPRRGLPEKVLLNVKKKKEPAVGTRAQLVLIQRLSLSLSPTSFAPRR